MASFGRDVFYETFMLNRNDTIEYDGSREESAVKVEPEEQSSFNDIGDADLDPQQQEELKGKTAPQNILHGRVLKTWLALL